MSSRIVVKKQSAGWISAKPDARGFPFREEFRGRPGNCRKKPIEAIFASEEFDLPRATGGYKLVMTFGDPQDFVDGYYPVAGNVISCRESAEAGAQGVAQTFGTIKKVESGLGVGFGEGQKFITSFRGNDPNCAKERYQLLPTESVRGAGGRQRWKVAEVNREAPANEDKAEVAHELTFKGHLTVALYQNG